jgi:enoyl-CoA hydratase/carnithine racemase
LGPHFTAGLDLKDVVPQLQAGAAFVPEGGIDPWGLATEPVRKPVVAAAHGKCLTLGIELLLASDIRVATATFAQLEVARGIYPFGGATVRFPHTAGWGNAMRWMLTGDGFDATEALRLGLIQEVVPDGEHVERAVEIARRIARQAPLGVQATLRSARRAAWDGPQAAERELLPEVIRLLDSEDANLAMQAFLTGREVLFGGR